jgi:protein TonB
MYRSDLKTRDKGGAIAAVIAIHAALLFVFMHLSGEMDVADPQRELQVFDITEVPPSPPPTPEPPRLAEQTRKPKDPEGAASRENIRSQATPVVAPRPPIALPIPLPVNVSQTPNEGAAPTQGASDVPGPGTGAGGTGTGTGSGGSGSGTGGGGGIATRAQPITRGPRGRDFPSHLRRLLSDGYSPWVKFTIEPSGRLSNCRVYQTSGNAELDNATCALVTRHLVYRPATNRRGEPVASEGIYRQAF